VPLAVKSSFPINPQSRAREGSVNAKHFSQRVEIFVGLGFPREVDTVGEAFEVLNEWSGRRGPRHAQALSRCRSALTNDVDVETARTAFEAFARARGILAPEALTAAANEAAREWLEN
jgi:hypothetical protein